MDRVPEKFTRINALIKGGNLDTASTELSEIVQDAASSNSDKLCAYNKLIRIAGETRSLEKIPSYIEKIKSISVVSDEEKEMFARCLHSIATTFLYAGQYEQARRNYEQALKIATQLEHKSLVFLASHALAEVDRSESQYDKVLSQIDTLMELARASGSAENTGLVRHMEGNVRRKLGQYREALIAFEQAKEVFQENKSSSAYHHVLWAMGTCYAALEDKEKAIIYLDLARSNAQEMPFWRIKILSSLTLAELYTVVGQYNQADAVYKKIADEVGTDETSYYGRRLLRGQTLLLIKKGEFEPANELIDKLVVVAVKEKNQKDIMRLRLLKAEVLLRTGDAVQQDEARDMLQETLAFFREKGVRRHEAVALELLARLDSRSGYHTDALKKVEEMVAIAEATNFERLVIRGQLARMVLQRKLGQQVTTEQMGKSEALINKLNAESERTILSRFRIDNYDTWSQELRRLDPNFRRYVNEFFEDFHFVPQQSTDIEIDRNSHYIREKHLGEIPFHNKFTLMRILLLLAETPGKEFSKEQLAKEIWGQEYNPLRHDNNIYININRLRKLIEPNPRESRYIMNGPRGYYFNPEMKVNISSKISDVAPRAVAPMMSEEA